MAPTYHKIARHLFQYGLVSLGVFVVAELLKPGIITQTIDPYWYVLAVLGAGVISLHEHARR